MDQEEKRELMEVAMQAFGQVINGQQNRIFNKGALRPDIFPSNAYPKWVQWKSHLVAVEEANCRTDIQATNALPVGLNGHALDEVHASPTELKQTPTLRYGHSLSMWTEF